MSEVVLYAFTIGDMPWWAWIVPFIGVFLLFGDRGLWDFEVKFPMTEGVGRGEVEFECWKKKGTFIEARFTIEPESANEEMDIFHNGERVYTIPAQKNAGGRVYVNEKITFEKPTEGDHVTVHIRNQEVFSGPLIKD